MQLVQGVVWTTNEMTKSFYLTQRCRKMSEANNECAINLLAKELTVTNLIFLGDIDHINLSSSLADRAFTLFQTSCPAISSTST